MVVLMEVREPCKLIIYLPSSEPLPTWIVCSFQVIDISYSITIISSSTHAPSPTSLWAAHSAPKWLAGGVAVCVRGSHLLAGRLVLLPPLSCPGPSPIRHGSVVCALCTNGLSESRTCVHLRLFLFAPSGWQVAACRQLRMTRCPWNENVALHKRAIWPGEGAHAWNESCRRKKKPESAAELRLPAVLSAWATVLVFVNANSIKSQKVESDLIRPGPHLSVMRSGSFVLEPGVNSTLQTSSPLRVTWPCVQVHQTLCEPTGAIQDKVIPKLQTHGLKLSFQGSEFI